MPTDAWYTDGSGCSNTVTWTEITIQPNTDANWMKIRMNTMELAQYMATVNAS